MCIRYILLCCCFSLAESALSWDQEPLNPTTAVEGTNVSLKWDYNLDGGTLDQVQWIQPESGLTIGRITPPSSYSVKAKFRPRFTINKTEEATLIITNVSRSDAGEIDCKVEDDADEIVSRIRLIVLYRPENVSLHTSANVSATLRNRGENFWCTADGNPAPHYKLSYNSTDLGENSSGTFQVRVTESGLYVCEANNSAGIGSASVHINVVDPAAADVSSTPGHVVEGHDVTLHCKVTGSPPLSIKWTKVNESNVLSNSSKLTLYNVTRPGTPGEILHYQCTAKNAYGDPASDVATIQVYYPPENTVMNVSVQEGNTSATLRDTFVTFNCSSHASPPPSVYLFYYNGAQFGSSSSGMLKKQVSESGHYFCAPKNKVGFGDNESVSIAVVDSPTVDLSSNPNSVREGGTVNLTSAVTGSKPISVEWKEDGDSKVLSRNRLLTRRNVTRPNTLNQTLRYKCIARNGYGEAKSDILTIRVNYPPENTILTVSVQKGNTSVALRHTLVTFNCTSHASPPPSDYSFYHNDAPFGSSSSGILKKNVFESGSYSCAPKNEVGFGGNASVFLKVVVATKIAAPQSIQLVEGTSDTLFCNATGDPEPSVKWRKDDDPEVISTSPKYTVSANKAVTKYHCEAQNGYGHPLIQKVTFVVSMTELEKEDSKVQVKLRIVSEEYVEEYSNPMSNKFKALASRLISENSLLFTKGNLKLLGSRIDRISNGSIVVEYTMFFRGSVEKNAVADTIKRVIEDGRFGNFTVDKDSLEVTQTTATQTQERGQGKSCSFIKQGENCEKLSTAFMIIIIIVVLVVVFILVIVVIWRCKKKRRCRKGSVDAEQDHDVVDGNGAVLSMQNMGYANEGPSAADGSGYVHVDHGPAPGAAEGNYAEVGKAGAAGGVPLVAHAAVDQSKKKKKKKKKGEKLEEDDMQGTATYAQVDKSKKKEGAAVPEENAYAAVDMSKKKKKRKEGELFYADLSEFSGQRGGLTSVQVSPPPTLGPVKVPPKYESTEYAYISQFSSKKKEDKPVVGEEGKPEQQKPAADAAGPDGGIVVKEQEGSKDEQGQVEAKL